jgi:hypothetical protein
MMSNISNPKTEVQPKPTRRRFTADRKREIVRKVEQCRQTQLQTITTGCSDFFTSREGLSDRHLSSLSLP